MAVTYDPSPHPIRIARQKQGLTLVALAALADVPLSALTKIETGHQARIFVDHLARLGRALDIEWWKLVSPKNLS